MIVLSAWDRLRGARLIAKQMGLWPTTHADLMESGNLYKCINIDKYAVSIPDRHVFLIVPRTIILVGVYLCPLGEAVPSVTR